MIFLMEDDSFGQPLDVSPGRHGWGRANVHLDDLASVAAEVREVGMVNVDRLGVVPEVVQAVAGERIDSGAAFGTDHC